VRWKTYNGQSKYSPGLGAYVVAYPSETGRSFNQVVRSKGSHLPRATTPSIHLAPMMCAHANIHRAEAHMVPAEARS
jgi:hypothetical protein